jgi:hypothetical protein
MEVCSRMSKCVVDSDSDQGRTIRRVTLSDMSITIPSKPCYHLHLLSLPSRHLTGIECRVKIDLNS